MEIERERATAHIRCAAWWLLVWLLAWAAPSWTQGYGARLGNVQRGGNVSWEPRGPGVLFDALDPSVRATHCLEAEGIKTLSELVERTEADMLKIRNFGKTSLRELKKKLEEMGLSFGMQVPA